MIASDLEQQLEAALRAYLGLENIPPERLRWDVSALVRLRPVVWKQRYEMIDKEAVKQVNGLGPVSS